MILIKVLSFFGITHRTFLKRAYKKDKKGEIIDAFYECKCCKRKYKRLVIR